MAEYCNKYGENIVAIRPERGACDSTMCEVGLKYRQGLKNK